MYRAFLCVAAALLSAGMAAFPAAADDSAQCRLTTLPEIALAACGRLIANGTKDPEVYYQRGWLYAYRKIDNDRAITDFDQAIRLSSNNEQYYKDRAAVYVRKGDYDRAAADWGQVIRIYPSAHASYTGRAQVFYRKGDYDRAIADYDQAIRLFPTSAPLYAGRADAFHRKGEYDRAVADFGEAIRLDPASATAYTSRAALLYRKGDDDRAFADYDEAIRLRPDAAAYTTRAGAYGGRAAYDRAIVDYDEAIRLSPDFAEAWHGRAAAFVGKRDADRATADLDEALRRGLPPPYFHAMRGAAFILKGEPDRAIADLDEAIRLLPNLVVAYASRGFAWNTKGEYDRAIADFDQALKLAPGYPHAYSHRGVAYGQKGDFDRAMADLDKAIALNPKYPRGYGNRAVIHFLRGDRDRAKADYETALRLDPYLANAADLRTVRAAFAPKPEEPPAAPAPHDPAIAADRRVALVIGNSSYAFVPFLPNPRRDAEAVAAALRQDGFQTVRLATDLGRDAMRDALRTFRDAADKADWGLIYYAGHGLQTGRANHLVPVDARLRDERDVDGETISYAEVEAAVGGARTLRVIILDACRVDPFAAQMVRQNPGRALSRGLGAPPEPEPGMLVAYSARDGQVAEDGDGDNSPFALALVKQLQVPGREVRRVFDFVRDDVVHATGRRQQPFTYGSLPGDRDFFFVPVK